MPPKGWVLVGWRKTGKVGRGKFASAVYAKRYPHLVVPAWKKPKLEIAVNLKGKVRAAILRYWPDVEDHFDLASAAIALERTRDRAVVQLDYYWLSPSGKEAHYAPSMFVDLKTFQVQRDRAWTPGDKYQEMRSKAWIT